jgi:hypothetical protein
VGAWCPGWVPCTAGVGAWCPGGSRGPAAPAGESSAPGSGDYVPHDLDLTPRPPFSPVSGGNRGRDGFSGSRGTFSPQTGGVKGGCAGNSRSRNRSPRLPGSPLGTATLPGRIVVPAASGEIALIRWCDRAVSLELRRSRPRSRMHPPRPAGGARTAPRSVTGEDFGAHARTKAPRTHLCPKCGGK